MNRCERLRVGQEFLDSISWPSVLRDANHDRCYCDRCYLSTMEDVLNDNGGIYVIPRGWTRFGVHIDEVIFEHLKVWETWVNCYHGTDIEKARSIIEHRGFLLPQDTTMHGTKIEICEGHIPEQHFVFTTPSIRYAGLNCYARTYEFTSPHDLKSYAIAVALQCRQKPDSFKVQPETVGAEKRQERICPHIPNHELEWKTQKRQAIMAYGLLLRIEKCHENEEDRVVESRMTTNIESTRVTSTPATTYERRPETSANIVRTDRNTNFIIDDEEDQYYITKKKKALLFMIFVLTLLPIAIIIIGQIYKGNCPIQPWIPQWMTIFGAAGVGGFTLLFCTVFITFKYCSYRLHFGYCLSGSLVCLLLCFFLGWTIMGSIWTFPIKSKVQFNQSDAENYCEKNVYMVTFGLILAQYGLIGLFLCLCSTAAVCSKCRSY